MGALAPAYRPRRPTETVLFAVVRDHMETFLAHARETYDAPLPRYVERELRGYRIKKLRDGRAKHRIMTPLEFLARLAAIVAPPQFPLLPYAGALAPATQCRAGVV